MELKTYRPITTVFICVYLELTIMCHRVELSCLVTVFFYCLHMLVM